MAEFVLRVLPEATRDIFDAERWYWQRSVVAADGFLADVQHAFGMIKAAPDRWPSYRRGTRRFVLERYPFSIVYRIEDATIWVVAVAHAKRRPEYWRRRRTRVTLGLAPWSGTATRRRERR